MTFADWLAETRERYRTQPAGRATTASAGALFQGGVRRAERLVDTRLGTPIWERDDWDVCVVLDACRVDVLREVAPDYAWLPAPDDVGAIWSPGSMSPQWLDETFHDGYADERARSIHVTGNPFSGKDSGPKMPPLRHDALPLDPDDFAVLSETWRAHWSDDATMAISPDPITNEAVAFWRERDRYAADRMVVHYMQPHLPFRSRPEWFGTGRAPEVFGVAQDDPDVEKDHWHQVRDGDLPADEFWAAYRDNLRYVLEDAVAVLRENIDGRLAITADHGNGFGEWGTWSHPPNCLTPSVRRVPWVVIDGTDTGAHDPDISPLRQAEADDRLEDRLRALGYASTTSATDTQTRP